MLEFNPIFAACNISCSWDDTHVFTEGKIQMQHPFKGVDWK